MTELKDAIPFLALRADELAAVMAAEQIYRALTVVYGLPYHCGH